MSIGGCRERLGIDSSKELCWHCFSMLSLLHLFPLVRNAWTALIVPGSLKISLTPQPNPYPCYLVLYFLQSPSLLAVMVTVFDKAFDSGGSAEFSTSTGIGSRGAPSVGGGAKGEEGSLDTRVDLAPLLVSA